MGNATIFAGSKIKALKSTLNLNGGADVISSTTDPSSGAGVSATLGSLLLNTSTGVLYQKTSAPNTGWVVASLTGALPTTGGTLTGNLSFNAGFGDLTSAGSIAGKLINMREFVSGTAATYTPTTGTRMILLTMVGGGGGSGGRVATGTTGNGNASGGGGAGQYIKALINVTTAATGTYTIGAGGTAGANTGTNGGTGGATTFTYGAASLTANGGSGGVGATTATSNTNANGAGGSGGAITGSNVISSFSRTGVSNPTANNVVRYVATGTWALLQCSGPAYSQYAKEFGYPTPYYTDYSSFNSFSHSFSGIAAAPTQPGSGANGTGYLNISLGGVATPGYAGAPGAIMIFEYA